MADFLQASRADRSMRRTDRPEKYPHPGAMFVTISRRAPYPEKGSCDCHGECLRRQIVVMDGGVTFQQCGLDAGPRLYRYIGPVN